MTVEQGGHVTEQLPAYAIGCLDEDEAAVVARHLELCAACRAELAPYHAVAGRLAFAAPDAAPPAGLKQRILEQAEVGRGAQPRNTAATASEGGGRSAPAAWWRRLSDLFRGAAPAWGLAAVALAVLLVVSNFWWWQHVQEKAAPSGMSAIALAGTGAAPDAIGTLVVSADGEYGTLVVDGLPMLDRAHTYQLWLIRDGRRTSGGVFGVSDHGYGALVVSSPEPLSSYQAFGVTVEPVGGSPGPTGERVLGSAE